MALKNDIDVEHVTRSLSEWMQRALSLASPVEITDVVVPQASGLSALTVLFGARFNNGKEMVAGRYVARCVPREGGVFEYCDLSREFRLLQALSKEGSVPVPAPLQLEDRDDSILGAPFYVMAEVSGRVAPDDPPYTVEGWICSLAEDDRAVLAGNALAALVDLQAIDPEKADLLWLDDGAVASPELRNKITGLRRHLDWASEGKGHQVIERALDWLQQNQPPVRSAPVVSWGDARLGNMIIGADLSVAAVIDWEMAGLGPRELDLGWWILTRRFHTSAIDVPVPGGFPEEPGLVRQYAELSGHEPEHLDYFIAFAATRLSIVFVRLASMMIAAGLLSPDSPMANNNPALRALTECLDLGELEGQSEYFVGNR